MSQKLGQSDNRERGAPCVGVGSIPDLLVYRIARVREHASSLLGALALTDTQESIALAERIRADLVEVERMALVWAIADPERYDEIMTDVVQLQAEVRRLIDVAPRRSRDAVSIRRYLARFGAACLSKYRRSPRGAVYAPNETLCNLILEYADIQHGRLNNATLRNIVAHEANLSHMHAPGVTVIRTDLWRSRMLNATLNACRAEESRFAMVVMAYASMLGATVTRCDFRDAILRDVDIESAAFIGCDFRGATFLVTQQDVGTARAEFIRCDLRGTNWEGRDLARVRFVECKVAGLRGKPRANGLVVIRPDLSAAGDGSRIAPMSPPEMLWDGAR